MMKIKYKDVDFKAVHAIGNGSVCTYFCGVNIIDTFGPNYSVPTMCTMELQAGENDFYFEGKREKGRAIWTHQLFEKELLLGTIVDFVPPNSSILVRKFDLEKPVSFIINRRRSLPFQRVSKIITESEMPCYASEVKEGTLLYSTNGIDRGYVINTNYFMALAGSLGTKIEEEGESLIFTVSKGFAVFAFDENLMSAISSTIEMTYEKMDALLKETQAYWDTFTAKRQKNVPLKNAEIEIAVDDVAVMIKAQQSKSGGILAGYNYHLSYVRDNYGTMRGLLAMGCLDEARALATYYRGVFQRNGKIKNAQGMDVDCFHIHENDAVEITGYMVLMMTDFFECSKDAAFLNSVLPLMKWCILEQHSWLKKGMLPFNGDETYIAGGIIPRSVLNDGSMEAVLLYHTACTRLLELKTLFENDDALFNICIADKREIEATFADNFIIDGKIACNNPDYVKYAGYPKYRRGVMQCNHGFGFSFRNKLNQYVCLDCMNKEAELPLTISKIYYLNSVALMPRFIHSSLINESLLAAETERLVKGYKEKGSMPTGSEVNAIVGYDLGLFINALSNAYLSEMKLLLEKMLSLRDATGVWVEYYINDMPFNTMCRPWESGINIMAAVKMDSLI